MCEWEERMKNENGNATLHPRLSSPPAKSNIQMMLSAQLIVLSPFSRSQRYRIMIASLAKPP